MRCSKLAFIHQIRKRILRKRKASIVRKKVKFIIIVFAAIVALAIVASAVISTTDSNLLETELPHVDNPDSVDTAELESTVNIIGWNVESGGNDPDVIAVQIANLDCDILALNEVNEGSIVTYDYAFQLGSNCLGRSKFIKTESGRGDKLAIFFDDSRFEMTHNVEMNRYGDYTLNDGNHRSPLFVVLKDRQTGFEFIVMTNHLARRSLSLRQSQAAGLREWARDSNMPIIAIGDFNFDYSFKTSQGNDSFIEFMRDGVWKWVAPNPLIDTQWSDHNGEDRYPDSLLDFVFVANGAKELGCRCNVIVTPGDFPDSDQTSDHRPVKLTFQLPYSQDAK